MTPVHTNRRGKTLVNHAFRRVAVGVPLGEEFHRKNRMSFQEFLHLSRLVRRGVVYEQDYLLQTVPLCVCGDVGQVPPEFPVPPPLEAVPDNCFPWPEESNEAVDALCITKRRHSEPVALERPASLDLRQQLNPLLVLERYCDPFFKSAGAMRL